MNSNIVDPSATRFASVAVVRRPLPGAVRPFRWSRPIEWATVGLYLALLSVAIVFSTATRLYWFDEIFTVHLARDPLALVTHLRAGADQNPPLGYLLTSLCIAIFGEREWAVRVPALAGALMASLGLYLFVRRRRGPWEAFLAMAVAFGSAPFWVYFLEARPYGLAIGFTALALVAWQCRRPFAFGLCIVLGLLSHYYFAVAILAFAIAEVVRAIQDRRVDRRIVAGFVASGITLLAMQPFWGNTSKQYSAHFWSKVKFNAGAVENAYAELARKELAIPFAVAMIAGIAFARRTDPKESYPVSEAVLIAAIAAGPAIGVWLGAKIVGRTSGGHRGALGLASVVFVSFGLVGNLRPAHGHYRMEAKLLHETAAFLREHSSGTVLVEAPFEFVRLWHYHPEQPVESLADLNLALAHTKSDTVDRGLLALAKVTPVPLTTPDAIAERLKRGEAIHYFGMRSGWHHIELERRGIAFEPIATRFIRK
jgi:Dolichyl-phosphate-mannose-protein mannosyltransferase